MNVYIISTICWAVVSAALLLWGYLITKRRRPLCPPGNG